MKRTALLAVLTALVLPLSAADKGLEFKPHEVLQGVLARQEGQKVELHLRSGEKIAGKLEKVGSTLVQVTQLAGAEFYEAVVAIDAIVAVVVRAKTN